MKNAIERVSIDENLFRVHLNIQNIRIEKKEITASLGYEDVEMPSHFEEMVDKVLAQLSEKCNIQAGYRLVDANKTEGVNDGLYIGKKFFHLHNIVTSQFRKAKQVALFVCTIGSGMEEWAKKLALEGDVPFSYVVDTVASETVEQATNILHDLIGLQMESLGLNITNRYSPGYCNWSVSEQHLLFSFLPKNFCGVTLTESALMVPIKSVSGIIGIGKDVRRQDYICDKCGVKDCTYRIILEAKKKRAKFKNSQS